MGRAQLVEQRERLRAGQFGQFVLVQGCGAQQVEGGARALLEGERLPAEVVAGVDAPGVQAGDDGHRAVAGAAEAGAQDAFRRAAAGGEQQDALTAPGTGQRGGGGEGGTAGAAGAGDEDGTHGQWLVASPAGAAGPLSTRFFSPSSARSMMTFSALRLIMPSIGILTSTVSW